MAARKATSREATVGDVLAAVHRIAPAQYAESWDNVGLQTGDPAAPAGRVMVALEVTGAVLREAEKGGVGTLVVHHPLIFRGLKSLAETSMTTRLLAGVMRAGIAVIAAHTNLDAVACGTNGELADRLGMQAAGRTFLEPIAPTQDQVKVVVFVPLADTERVFEAMTAAGAGVIGNYSHASFRLAGTGTFKPLEGANPAIGAVGNFETVEENRLEMLCPRALLRGVVMAMLAAHPYEVPAYEAYPLLPTGAPEAGIGLVGDLKEPTTLGGLAERLKRALATNSAGVVGKLSHKVRRVAVCSGAGGECVRTWREGTADVFVTGEMNHHDCLEAADRGLPVILVGHWASEAIVCERFADMIGQQLAEAGLAAPRLGVSKAQVPPLMRV